MTKERRNYFRVNQEVIFDFHSVDAYTAENDAAAAQFNDTLPLQMLAEFRQIDKQAQELQHQLSETNRALVEYLSYTNRKIELLAREMIAQQRPDFRDNTSKINLSEAGIAFLSEKAYYKGSYLALKLVFLPHFTGVSLFAQVIRCEPAQKSEKDGKESDLYHIAAKFYRISEPEQQILAKTVLDAQLAAKRHAKPDSPNSKSGGS